MIIFIEEEEDFKSLLEKQLSLHVKYWTKYTKNNVHAKKVYALGLEIFKNNDKIENTWQKIQNLIGNYVQYPYLIYAIYQYLINNSTIKSEEIF